MTSTDATQPPLVLEYQLDAPPEKVWRAIGIPALREQWLPNAELADTEPVVITPGEAISYRMRDDRPPYLESTVTLQILPAADGGSHQAAQEAREGSSKGRCIGRREVYG